MQSCAMIYIFFRFLVCLVFLLCLTELFGATATVNEVRHPVILVPGDGGSQLFAKLDKPKSVAWYCKQKTSDFFLLWLNVLQLTPLSIHCFTDNIRLQFDSSKKMSTNSPGVSITVPGFGKVDNIEWLSNLKLPLTSYFHSIINELETNFGYERNVDILGAPFDFRKSPNEQSTFFDALKELTEQSYASTGQSVIFMAHSLGCLYTLHFLIKQNLEWKAKYVHSFVVISGPIGGSSMTLQALGSGDTLGIPVIQPLSVRPAQRSWPSTYYMLPNPAAWSKSDVLAMGKEKNYTMNNYNEFLIDSNNKDGVQLLNFAWNVTNTFQAPGVKVHCIHGVDVKTAALFKWQGKNHFDEPPEIIEGDGDGTVNANSLRVCSKWASRQNQSVNHKELSGVNHLGILNDRGFLTFLRQIIAEN